MLQIIDNFVAVLFLQKRNKINGMIIGKLKENLGCQGFLVFSLDFLYKHANNVGFHVYIIFFLLYIFFFFKNKVEG